MKSQITTASGIVGAFKHYKSAIDVLQLLEDELGVRATIDATQLVCRYGKIKKELHKLNPDANAVIKRFYQTGILDKGCPFHPGIGYVRPGSLASLLGKSPPLPKDKGFDSQINGISLVVVQDPSRYIGNRGSIRFSSHN